MAYSGQAKIAYDHGFYDALYGRERNNPYKKGIVRKSWQAYEEGYDEGQVSDTPPRGPQGEKGDKGDQGDTGPIGPQGPAGPEGDQNRVTAYFLGQ